MWTALLLGVSLMGVELPQSARATAAAERVRPALVSALAALQATPGDPVFLRIYKESSELELWIQPGGQGRYVLQQVYPVCRWSGRLGPKTREGDLQAPEGIYAVGPRQLNPYSQYHLSFNLGYPNRYEQAMGWTGSALMVHGNCVSVGCFAMTDAGIEPIYTLLAAALAAGQPTVPVHSFPFRMDPERLQAERDSPHHAFWQQLLPIHAAFESTHVPPAVVVGARGYRLRDPPPP